MYAVGVGKAVEEELHQIASEPAELHVSYSPDFSSMTHLLDNLKGSICPGEHICLWGPRFHCPTSDTSLSSSLPPLSLSFSQGMDSLDRALLLKEWSVDQQQGCHLVAW